MRKIVITMLTLFVLVNTCKAQEGGVQPQGCLDRLRARCNACLPEARFVKQALSLASIVHVSGTGLMFAGVPHDIGKIMLVPLAMSIPIGTLGYRIFKKENSQALYHDTLGAVSGTLATWLGAVVAQINDWPPDLAVWYSALWGIGGVGVVTFSMLSRQQNNQHDGQNAVLVQAPDNV